MIGKVFKAYDVRAVYPKPLNEKIAWQVGHASAAYLLQEASRRSGELFRMSRPTTIDRAIGSRRPDTPALWRR